MLLQEQQMREPEAVQAEVDSIEKLRQILTTQQHRNISYDEAGEISDALVEFYQTLAEEVDDEPTV